MESLQTLVLPARVTGEQPRDGSLLHGRYRLLERLGAGGFGVVWRARDELLHREVALKRIPLPPQASAPGAHGREEPPSGERATREALAAARLAHPAIVALYEAYVDDDAFYLISELVHGDTLAALIAADALPDEQLLRIGLALAQALTHAHARGVIHRDVKPHNVLVPDDRDIHETPAKLTDFGGASLSGVDALTRTGETLGTLAYMAPEQSEGLEVGEPADLYSLALVLYEGLTGVNPVRGLTPAATARRIGRQLPPLATRRSDLPRELSDALDTALAVDPDRRGTLDELCVALERALAQGLTRRRGLFGGARTFGGARSARAQARPDLADWPDGADWPDLADWPASADAPTHAPASAGDRTAIDSRARDNRARPPRREIPAQRIEPVEDRLAHGDAPAAPEEPRARRHRFPLPRAVWVGCVLAAVVWLAITARPGGALLLAAAAAPLLLLGPRPGIGWLTAALAPLLGLAGLAGAYPALAGQASSWSRRALLGALGYWWLTLAGPLLAAGSGGSGGARLWLGPAAGTPARAVWEGSLDSAATHVVGPALSAGVLFGMLLWAAGAALLPWLVRGSHAILDTIAAVIWSAALVGATPYFDTGLSPGMPLPHPRGAVIGGILAAVIAIAARALRGPVGLRHP